MAIERTNVSVFIEHELANALFYVTEALNRRTTKMNVHKSAARQHDTNTHIWGTYASARTRRRLQEVPGLGVRLIPEAWLSGPNALYHSMKNYPPSSQYDTNCNKKTRDEFPSVAVTAETTIRTGWRIPQYGTTVLSGDTPVKCTCYRNPDTWDAAGGLAQQISHMP